MNILVLNASPRPNGNTKKLVHAFADGAETARNMVRVLDIAKLRIADCRGCEYCHAGDNTDCIQRDDMKTVIALLKNSHMLVLASPVYYHGITGQMKCLIDRMYPIMNKSRLPKLKSAAMILCSVQPNVYDGAIYMFREEFEGLLNLENKGIFTACRSEIEQGEILNTVRRFGESLI